VQKPDAQRQAPILLVCPTNTWLAYNSKPFLKKQYQVGSDFKETYIQTWRRDDSSGTDVPEFSCYQAHHNFAPGYHFGRLLPNPAADPYVTYGSDNYGHLTRGTRLTQAWLELNGYQYDMISDLDLHTTPGILGNYQTVIIAGHSEYWSFPAYNGVKSYLNSNGKLIVLSGNTMYWRVSFSPDGTIMEQRKWDDAGARIGAKRRGELWNTDDGRRGGVMRECGFPGWLLTGLETYGIFFFGGGAPGDKDFGTFQVTAPRHFLFGGLRLDLNQRFAPNTVGHESDVRVATLETLRATAAYGLPDGATAPIEPPGITTLATGSGAVVCCDDFDYFLDNLDPNNGPENPDAEIIYWERPDGGRVFNAGAIGNGIALYYNDPVFVGLVRNVLKDFLGD